MKNKFTVQTPLTIRYIFTLGSLMYYPDDLKNQYLQLKSVSKNKSSTLLKVTKNCITPYRRSGVFSTHL